MERSKIQIRKIKKYRNVWIIFVLKYNLAFPDPTRRISSILLLGIMLLKLLLILPLLLLLLLPPPSIVTS